jgi:hypothetical protein
MTNTEREPFKMHRINYNVITKFSWLEKQMTNNNMWDCAERSFSVDDSSVFKYFFFNFWYVS